MSSKTNSLRDRYKELTVSNKNLTLLNDKLIKEIGESRKEKKEVYKILNCLETEGESLKECSVRHNDAMLSISNRNSDLEIDLKHQKEETNGLNEILQSNYDDFQECERILDSIKIDDTNQVDPLMCDRNQIKNGECIAVNEKELNILKEKKDAFDEELYKAQLKLQDLKKQNLTDSTEDYAEYAKVVLELDEEVTRSKRNRDEIKKAKEVLQCDSSDEELGECAERTKRQYEAFAKELQTQFQEELQITKLGYTDPKPSSPPTRATRRTAKTNNEFFRPGTVDAARYPPFTKF